MEECLTSILQQTYLNWEAIIINDGSPDNTEEIALKWCARDPRFTYKYKENGGLSSARNLGLSFAKGNWVQFLDCDDSLHFEKFERAVDHIKLDSTISLVLTNFKCFIQKNKELTGPYCDINIDLSIESFLSNWDRGFTIPIHCGLIQRSLLSSGFEESLKAKEDWIMWIRFFLQQINYCFINEPLCFYRVHNAGMTSNEYVMEINTIKAYNFIYTLLPEKVLREIFFKRIMSEYTLKENRLTSIYQSFTYKLGISILKPVKFILKKLIKNN